jgi:hypothetical protein
LIDWSAEQEESSDGSDEEDSEWMQFFPYTCFLFYYIIENQSFTFFVFIIYSKCVA